MSHRLVTGLLVSAMFLTVAFEQHILRGDK